MFSLFISKELNQINSFTNFQNQLLDQVFASGNDKMTIFKCNNPMVPVDDFHKPVEIKITLTCQELLL